LNRPLALALVLGLCLAGCAVDPGGGAPRVRRPDAATSRVWEWERTVAPSATLESPAPQRYTLELSPNGRLLVRADCNRGTGPYRIGEGTIALGPIATTRMACPPGSLDGPYLRDLQRASGFLVEGEHLFLELPEGSGTMRFKRAQ
jgi:heat shock protein HslJ